MKVTGARTLLLAGTGLALITATPATAQQQQDCVQRLDQIEQQIAQAEMASENRSDVEEVIEGARSLAESGDQEGCMNVVAELEDVVATLEQTGSLQAEQQPATGGQQAQPEQQAAETEQQQVQPEQQAAETEQQQVQPEQQAAETEQQQMQPEEEAGGTELQAGGEAQPIEPEEQAAETQTQPIEPEEQAAETETQQVEPEEQAAETETQPIEPEEQAAETEMQEVEPEEQASETETQPIEPEEQAAETEMQEAQPEEQQAAAAESPLAAIPATDLIGSEVVNDQGESIAEIIDLVRDNGEQMHAVLSVGGFLGIGAREVTVPLEEFDVGQEDQVVLAGMTEDALQEMPEYDEAQYQPVEQEQQQ